MRRCKQNKQVWKKTDLEHIHEKCTEVNSLYCWVVLGGIFFVGFLGVWRGVFCLSVGAISHQVISKTTKSKQAEVGFLLAKQQPQLTQENEICVQTENSRFSSQTIMTSTNPKLCWTSLTLEIALFSLSFFFSPYECLKPSLIPEFSSNNAWKSPALCTAHRQNYSICYMIANHNHTAQQAQKSLISFSISSCHAFYFLFFPFQWTTGGINCLFQSHCLELCRTEWHQRGNCHCSFCFEGEMWKFVNVAPGFSCCSSLLRNVTATVSGTFWYVSKPYENINLKVLMRYLTGANVYCLLFSIFSYPWKFYLMAAFSYRAPTVGQSLELEDPVLFSQWVLQSQSAP